MEPATWILVGPSGSSTSGRQLAHRGVRSALGALGRPVVDLSTSQGRDGSTTLIRRAADTMRVSAQILRARARGARHCYVTMSHGRGMLVESAFVALARLSGMSIVLHHHSRLGLEHRSRLLESAGRIAGPKANHVTQCDCLARGLSGRVFTGAVSGVSNAAWLEPSSAQPRSDRPFSVGYLGRVDVAKGFPEFAAGVGRVDAAALAVHVAGPVDPDVEQDLDALAGTHDVTRWGVVTGPRKTAFFDQLDVLVFPTRYRLETEGLVVLEAMQRGVFVIAPDVACTGRILPRYGAGVLDGNVGEWPTQIAGFIAARRSGSGASSTSIRDHFDNLRIESQSDFASLIGRAEVRT